MFSKSLFQQYVFVSDENCLQIDITHLKILSRENGSSHFAKVPTKVMVWGPISQLFPRHLSIVFFLKCLILYIQLGDDFSRIKQATILLLTQAWTQESHNMTSSFTRSRFDRIHMGIHGDWSWTSSTTKWRRFDSFSLTGLDHRAVWQWPSCECTWSFSWLFRIEWRVNNSFFVLYNPNNANIYPKFIMRLSFLRILSRQTYIGFAYRICIVHICSVFF